jgi:diphthamide synthase (EF-2-diphthine--ammonia ligase)
MEDLKSRGVFAVGFGDLFLEDLRAWREKNLAKASMVGVFPIWKRDTRQLSRQIVAMGFKAVLSCVEGKVGPGFAGRAYHQRLLADLPAGIDPCGEYGEFHSFVYDGPCFGRPVAIKVGEIVIRDGRHYADLLLAGSAVRVPFAADDIPPV